MSTGLIKMSVYGKPKVGKTRFLSTFPKPLLILGTEDGTESVRSVKGVTFIRVIAKNEKPPSHGAYVRIDELPHLFNELRTDKYYQTTGLDTANRLSDTNLANIMGYERTPEKGLMRAGKDQYILNSYQTKTIISDLLSLPKNVVVVSHEKDFNRESDSEVRTPSISSALSEAVERLLNGDTDYVCQMFIRDQIVMQKPEGMENAVEVPMNTGKAEYCLRLGNHPHYVTGFRIAEGLTYPDVLVNPTYEKIVKILRGEKVQ